MAAWDNKQKSANKSRPKQMLPFGLLFLSYRQVFCVEKTETK